MDDNTLNKYWSSLKTEEYSDSYREIENWIRKENIRGINKSTAHKSYFIKTISENKIKYAVILASIFIIYVMGKIPVTQNKAIGNILTWSVDKGSFDAISKIDDFKWLDKSNLIVSDTTVDNKEVLNYKMLLPADVDKAELALISSDLLNISGYRIVPVYEPVKRPVYAAALFSLFDLDVSAIPVNNSEIYNTVNNQLRLAGLDDEIDVDIIEKNNISGIVHITPKRTLDSIRIKVHNDIVRNIHIEKSLNNLKKSLQNYNIRINSDSLIKRIIVKMDDDMLKNLSEDSEIFENIPVIDSIKVRVLNEKMKKLNVKMKHLQDSVLSKIENNIVIDVDIPDIDLIIDSEKRHLDLELLKDMKVKVFDEERLKELENLDEKINKEVQENLRDLDIIIDIDSNGYNYHYKVPEMPDSVKTQMKRMKIRVHEGHENDEQEIEIEEENNETEPEVE